MFLIQKAKKINLDFGIQWWKGIKYGSDITVM